jgi:predicted nucleic acid-binding protein
MNVAYLDSSVALRTILDVPERTFLQTWLDEPGRTYVSSRLLRTEVIRVLRRDGRPPRDASALLSRVGLVDITRETHAVAESFEHHVRSLDALHVATALLIGESVTMVTHDRGMKVIAERLGLDVVDPVEASTGT